MEYENCKTCDFKYNPGNDFTHKLSKLHLALTNQIFCQKRKIVLSLNESNQLMLCVNYGKFQPSYILKNTKPQQKLQVRIIDDVNLSLNENLNQISSVSEQLNK